MLVARWLKKITNKKQTGVVNIFNTFYFDKFYLSMVLFKRFYINSLEVFLCFFLFIFFSIKKKGLKRPWLAQTMTSILIYIYMYICIFLNIDIYKDVGKAYGGMQKSSDNIQMKNGE